MNNQILLGHGSGGKLSHELIEKIFIRYFDNPVLKMQTDAALLHLDAGNIAFTTDSYVIDPVFFPGGNIGKLAIDGTVNDLAVSAVIPLYISASFILEEGFGMTDLENIVKAMADEAEKAGVIIVTGDTKVVNRGKCDKIFINTSGIGILQEKHSKINTGSNIKTGDKIIVNGTIGDHGMAVMAAREDLNISSEIRSDSSALNHLIQSCLERSDGIHFMRDATRGGLAGVLCEVVAAKSFGIILNEALIPVNEAVRGMCELLGIDPLYVANEGKVVMIAEADEAEKILRIQQSHPQGKHAAIIGEVTALHHGMAVLKTEIGGSRIIDMLAGEQLPRIC